MMISLKDKVLAFVRLKGPVLPVHINKEIERDSFFSGAILSELIENKLVKISCGKIGGSPVYYVQGQESKLDVLYNHLPMREKEAYNLLKEKQVLWDGEVNPGIRVALRIIKDFAMPIKLQRQNREELAWHWHLLSPQEAMKMLQPKQQESHGVQPVQQQHIPMQKIERIEQEQKPLQPLQAPLITSTQTRIVESQLQKEEEKKPERKQQQTDFMQQINTYLAANNLQTREEQTIRKNKEYEYHIILPSNIGAIDYLLIAKSKKTINEADLSLAHQRGQSRKLSVILLTNGELTKKAREYREKNLKGYVLVKRL